MSSPPDPVKKLVDNFAEHVDHYKSTGYNETEVRREYLDPFWKALGWDIDNRSGYADQYKDVIHEDAIKVGDKIKAPDYSFRIGGTRKFFLEAKKPSVNIQFDTAPAYQLRRYAWSAKLPLSVLSDFEEFSVYDCRFKPDPKDKASKARTVYMRFDHYLDRWDEIEGIFSREAILHGSFDKYVVDNKRKRGTAEVDDVFLDEIERWRELLAKNLVLRNPGLAIRDLNYAVQVIIDRIIFLRICEDRGTEIYGKLRDTVARKDAYAELVQAFRDADARYNSGLFHFTDEKHPGSLPDKLTPTLAVDTKVLREIVHSLYYPESPYAFTVLPPDILGHVYEQFLGKTITLTGGEKRPVVKIEEKPEVRKAGGVYYTPTYIVDYIVENTLGRLLNGDDPENPKPIRVSQAEKLKVLDPACGSGSFLIVAYQYLLDWHRDQYTLDFDAGPDPETGLPPLDPNKITRHGGGKSPKIFQNDVGEYRLTIAERKRILVNNIHGVDIDSQAVEVTKLSLLLKVIEGESDQVQQTDWIRDRERILPNLGHNIQCGNSLIGPDFYAQPDLPELDDETRYRINVFDWEKGFPEVFENGGFDCVIGNPPYIRIQAMKEYAPQEVEFYLSHFDSAAEGNFDIYVCFVEQALVLMRADGITGFIVPHKFFQAKYGRPIREKISCGKHLRKLVHFGDNQIFLGASTYTSLLFLSKSSIESFEYLSVENLSQWRVGAECVSGTISSDTATDEEWNFWVGPEAPILEKLDRCETKFGDISSMFVGLQTSADTVFLFKRFKESTSGNVLVESKELDRTVELERELLETVVRSGSIGRFNATPTALVLFPYKISSGKAELIPFEILEREYPKCAAYLAENRELLENRERGKFRDKGWHQLYPKNLALWESPKLMIPYMVTRLAAHFDKSGLFFVNVTTGGFGVRMLSREESDLYFVGLVNSRLLNLFFIKTSSNFRGGYFAANKQFLANLPIRPIDFDNPADVAAHDKMVVLVDTMLDLHRRKAEEKNPQTLRQLETQITATDSQIDGLVYELYGLTDDEIALVEASN